MDRFRFPKSADVCLPSSWIGLNLKDKERKSYLELRGAIDFYLVELFDLRQVMKIVDLIELTKTLGHLNSMKVIESCVAYLRSLLLDKNIKIIDFTLVLLDILVKNCRYRIHLYIGKRRFMKTMCLVIRRLCMDERETHRIVGMRGLGKFMVFKCFRIIFPCLIFTNTLYVMI